MASYPHSNVICSPASRTNCARMIIHGPLQRLRLRPEKDVLEIIRQIAALPDPVGDHACECSHPEMRLVPDGIYRCSACGSEILPSELT